MVFSVLLLHGAHQSLGLFYVCEPVILIKQCLALRLLHIYMLFEPCVYCMYAPVLPRIIYVLRIF